MCPGLRTAGRASLALSPCQVPEHHEAWVQTAESMHRSDLSPVLALLWVKAMDSLSGWLHYIACVLRPASRVYSGDEGDTDCLGWPATLY